METAVASYFFLPTPSGGFAVNTVKHRPQRSLSSLMTLP